MRSEPGGDRGAAALRAAPGHAQEGGRSGTGRVGC